MIEYSHRNQSQGKLASAIEKKNKYSHENWQMFENEWGYMTTYHSGWPFSKLPRWWLMQ